MAQKEDYKPSGFGLAYMLAGDPPGGGASNIDPYATQPTADNQWRVEGAHVMILVPDPAMLEGMTTDFHTGGPYVMWKDTPLRPYHDADGPAAEIGHHGVLQRPFAGARASPHNRRPTGRHLQRVEADEEATAP